MPEYLAPGVYVEEVSFRSQSIEGVSTTTTAFIGATRSGPTTGPLQVLTSLSDFEQIYGDGQPIAFADSDKPMTNFMWQAARTFFEQGGQRLYVQRVCDADPVKPDGTPNPEYARTAWAPLAPGAGGAGTGASSAGAGGAAPAISLNVTARWPGVTMAGTPVTLSLNLGPNVLVPSTSDSTNPGSGPPSISGLSDYDVVCVTPLSPPTGPEFYVARVDVTGHWTFESPTQSPPYTGVDVDHLGVTAAFDPAQSAQIRVVTATVTVQPTTPGALPQVWSGLPLDPSHTTNGTPDSIFDVFTTAVTADTVSLPIVISLPPGSPPGSPPSYTGIDVLNALLAAMGEPRLSPDKASSVSIALTGGTDGPRPLPYLYENISPAPDDKSGLRGFEDIDEISIVAAPGSTFDYESTWRDQGATIMNLLIEHVEKMRYRVAVLDSGNGQTMANVQAMRAMVDSEYAAIYYPWVKVLDPITQTEQMLPPCGFVTGIYARNDIERAVYKAPANEPVLGALGFEYPINRAQQEVLNPLGINCFRFFEDRGYRLWGARTISSDPLWKYLNVRRYFAYLEHSIDKGTQWVVFEPNGPKLWANVRQTVSDFLFNEFQSGALMGTKPQEAYFVRCDQTTMTQNDIDNGRLVCLVGVSPLYPAEFVIFRIGQWTASAGQTG